MSEVESFIRFCDSDFGASVMDREATYLDQFVNPDDRMLDVGAGIGSIEHVEESYRGCLSPSLYRSHVDY